jgi:hypothetical protein
MVIDKNPHVAANYVIGTNCYFILKRKPAYSILPDIGPQTIDASKYWLKGLPAATIAFG